MHNCIVLYDISVDLSGSANAGGRRGPIFLYKGRDYQKFSTAAQFLRLLIVPQTLSESTT